MPKNKTYKTELKVTSLGSSGDGIAYHNNNKIFIPFALENETVLAEIKKDRGKIIKILDASQQRQTHPCPYFTKCGGCSMQHLNNDAYLNFKLNLLQTTLNTQGIDLTEPCKIVQTPKSSRRRVEFTFQTINKNNVIFGFNQKQTHNIVSIKNCLLLKPEINNIIEHLKETCSFFESKQKGDIKITVADNGLDIIFKMQKEPNFETLEAMSNFAKQENIASLKYNTANDLNFIPIAIKRTPIINFSGYKIPLPSDCFLQPSKEGEDFLTSFVTSEAKNAEKALDVFSGLGVFSFALATTSIKEIKAFDIDKKMISVLNDCTKNYKLNHISAYERNLFKDPLINDEIQDFDLVVIDPPRAGAKKQIEAISQAAKKPQKIIMISCNHATFARDAKTLINGGYKLQKLTALDQFAYSSHLELASIFVI